MTFLGIVNFLVAQWFCVRLTRVTETGKPTTWRILRYVLPLTGWWSDYVWLWRRWPR